MNNSDFSIARQAIRQEELRLYTDHDNTLLPRVYALAKDDFDFVHIHQWLVHKIDPAPVFELRGKLDKSHTLSLEIHQTQVIGCIVEENGSLTERKCHMTLDPMVWTDLVGWCSWARSTFEVKPGIDSLYVSVPVTSKRPWNSLRPAPSGIMVTDLDSDSEIKIAEDKWLEINPLRTALRPINQKYEPTGLWMHPPLETRVDTQSWVMNQLYDSNFNTVTPPGFSTMRYDPSDNYPKAPPGPSKYGGRASGRNIPQFPISRSKAKSGGGGWGCEVDLTVHVDSGIDDLDNLLEVASKEPALELDKNPGKGKADLAIETFEMMKLTSPKKKTCIRPDSGVDGLEDLF